MSGGADCNSNRAPDLNVTSFGSTAADEYQWFLDYGSQSQHQPSSILSSLETCEQLSYYNDLALAEVDMEDFRTEDIHSVLSALPAMCFPQIQAEREGEMFASIPGSLMDKYDLDTSSSPQSSSHGYDESGGSTMSICKSELLFSPVKECPLPVAGNFSVDSLDCDDLLLTCQANKDNYTIAFEASDESEYRESETTTSHSENWSTPRKALDTSMARSESIYTTWSKLRKRSSTLQLRRHASGNNNTASPLCLEGAPSALKSQSLPNLCRRQLTNMSTSEICCVKIYDTQSVLSDTTNSSMSCGSKKNNFSLIKLFMKQKSGSNEGMSVSSVSECWPPSNNSQSDSDSYAPDPTSRIRTIASNLRNEHIDNKLSDTNNVNAWIPSESTTEYSGFEDSLVTERKHGLIKEEDERSESVEQLSESVSKIEESILDLDFNSSSQSKSKCTIRFNVNNNNSIERVASPHRQRFCKGQGTQTKRLSFAGSTPSVASSDSYGSGEETEATGMLAAAMVATRNTSTQIPVHLIDRSMQTSGFADINSLNSAPFRILESPNGTSLVKVIVPTTNEDKKPIYVFYPNYSLPDLAFLREKQKDLDVANIFLLPQKLDKESPHDKSPTKPHAKTQRRPFSCNDVEALRKKGFGHIQDWDSLTFLLPREYRQILADVPEVMPHLKRNEDELKPLFCVSPQSNKSRPLSYDCSTLKSRDLKNTYEDTLGPLFSEQPTHTNKPRPLSCDCTTTIPGTQMSSTSSSTTQPSSGYRGSSTMLSDSSRNHNAYNPLFVYRYDSASSESSMFNNAHLDKKCALNPQGPPLPKRSISLPLAKNVPPRPPLPRGILRNITEPYNCKSHKNDVNKRYSMFELGGQGNKIYADEKDVDEMEDEGVDAGTCTDSSVEEAASQPLASQHTADLGCKKADLELLRLEELLQLSGLSQLKASGEHSCLLEDLDLAKLRQQVSKFLTTQDESLGTPNNTPECARKKTVSFAQLRENSAREGHPTGIAQKQGLVLTVCEAVEQLIEHFTSARDSQHCVQLGDTSHTSAIGQLILNTLCPALYAVLSDGLKPVIKTSFGDASNSVWQVVEAVAQQGPLTKSLNELVLTINTEHVITEGLIKFNAFLFGLLNVGSVDAWLAFLRTRDSVLRKHYSSDALLVLANTAGGDYRTLIDRLVESLKPLHLLPFNLDLLFECKQLKESLSRMEARNTSPTNKSWNFMKLVRSLQTSNTNWSQTKEPHHDVSEVKQRPRSCVETWTNMAGLASFPDIAQTIQKRWSNININSKLFQAFDRLGSEENTEEEYTDSLESRSRNPKDTRSPENTSDDNTDTISTVVVAKDDEVKEKTEGGKFRRLQRKWEMLSGKESPKSSDGCSAEENATPTIVSPTQNINTIVRSRIPRPVTSPVRPVTSPIRPVTSPIKTTPTTKKVVPPLIPPTPRPAKRPPVPRVSRLDRQDATSTAVRPTSLPYKGAVAPRNTLHRRAVSSSRKAENSTQRFVRTLSHHMASDNGHLSFKEGERLRVVLEVDTRWLLCCRGENKGLVLRSAVIRDN